MKVGVLGAGAVGERVTRQLAASPGVDAVVVDDRNPVRARAVAGAVGAVVAAGPVAVGAPVDVAVLVGPPGTVAERAHALIDAGIHVVTVTDTAMDARALLSLDGLARHRRRSLVVGAGFSPGLTCALAAVAAQRFATVDEVHVGRVGVGGQACAHAHRMALREPAREWRAGAWVERGGSGCELLWFPEPIGARDCYRAALAEPELLVDAWPELERATARTAATLRQRAPSWVPVVGGGHREGGLGAVRVDLRGTTADGGRHAVVLGALGRPAASAAAVAATTAMWVSQGRVRPGAGGLARLLDEPAAFLTAVMGRGQRIWEYQGAPG